MKFCSRCGKPAEAGSFCGNCGEQLTQEARSSTITRREWFTHSFMLGLLYLMYLAIGAMGSIAYSLDAGAGDASALVLLTLTFGAAVYSTRWARSKGQRTLSGWWLLPATVISITLYAIVAALFNVMYGVDLLSDDLSTALFVTNELLILITSLPGYLAVALMIASPTSGAPSGQNIERFRLNDVLFLVIGADVMNSALDYIINYDARAQVDGYVLIIYGALVVNVCKWLHETAKHRQSSR
jgi:hypothetical protein